MSERRIKAPKDDLPRPWERGPISIERWLRHRETMMQLAYPGSRPHEWWQYQKQMPRPEQETERLYDRGELSEAELAELMPGWRERYEQAQKPGFSYCIGHKNPGDTFASWIEGLAAQKALYRWAGIPVAIIRRWDAERRLSAKDVKSLAIRARSELNRLGGSVVRYFVVALLVPPLSGQIEMPYRGRRVLTEARVVGIGSRSTRASRSDLIVAGASCYLVRNAK